MRRRLEEEPVESATPLELRRFRAEEWGNDEQAARWYAARDRWAQEHGEPADADWDEPMPRKPFDPESM